MPEKVEFAGKEWVALAKEFLDKQMAATGDSLKGIDFALCEVFTDPPAHLLRGDDNRVAWWFHIKDGEVEVGDREIDIERKATLDYSETLPAAKTVYEGDPEGAAEAQKKLSEWIESGKVDPSFLEAPKAVSVALAPLHDHLARLTR